MDDVFAALDSPVRRRVLALLAQGERAAGEVVAAVRAEADISQPAVSQHLAVLREAGLVAVRRDGARRLYALDPAGLAVALRWLADLVDPLAPFSQPLDALATEVARGRRRARDRAPATADEDTRSA